MLFQELAMAGFHDRAEGGALLAAKLSKYANQPDGVVLGLPRGGVPVAYGVPVGARETWEEFRGHVDEIICAITPEPFYAVGLWYEDFSQTTDDEVRELLERAAEKPVERVGVST